ncbi:MAG TPA: TIM-barrel domain-containing protein [Edaphobacter sp.]|nr:TIM-barrel domain-containing protein [Edaphobacter sp.]
MKMMRLCCGAACVALALSLQTPVSANAQKFNSQIPAPASHAEPEASYSATADAKAMVVDGHARFTVLTPQLIRMEWAADGHFEDRPSLVFLNRRLPVPEFKVKRHGKSITIETSALRLQYKPKADGRFTADDLAVTLTSFKEENKPVEWHPGMADTGNLQGTTRTLDRARGSKTIEPIGPGLISRDGWTVVDDSTRPLFNSDNFTFAQGEKSVWPWAIERPAGERQDLYFFGYGHEYKQALGDFVRVAGRIPLPPRFAFGTWWSRYWAYSDQELDDLVKGFRENDTPLDVLVIDMDWHKTFGMHFERKDASGHALGWTGYSWNRLLFPDPAAFLGKLHRDGLKLTLNMHPASGVQPWEDQYTAMAKAMGQDPSKKEYVPFDITNQKFAQNYMDILHHPLEKEGVDFWWLDWQQEPNTKMPGVSPTWWLNYVHFTDQEREGKRPLLFHRWGGLGNHRYQIGFSGDTVSVWDSLAFQPWFTATAANVGYAYWSHDIGGHMPGVVDPQLFTRWVQFGAFSPILRTHTTKNPDAERRIWAYPEPYSNIMRKTFQLRYALGPYIYTEARRTYDTGVAFLHPLYYDYPNTAEAYTSKNEYAFGEQMIVSPVVQPVDDATQLAKESIWIPKGEWIERATGKHITGPRTVERSFAIDQEPVYLRAGAIIPMQPPMLYTGQKPIDPLILNVWPLADGQTSSYAVYADGSIAEEYKKGVYTLTPVKAAQHGDTLTVDVATVEGSYPGMLTKRGYELRLPADWPPESVSVNGQALSYQATDNDAPGWHYEGNTLTTVIRVASQPVSTQVHIEVQRRAGSLAARKQLDGFAGATARLRSAYDVLNQAWPFTWSPDDLIEVLQTGDRLSYHPETAQKELADFAVRYAAAETSVKALLDPIANLSGDQLTHELMKNKGRDTTVERAEHYKQSLQRAVAQLDDGKPF